MFWDDPQIYLKDSKSRGDSDDQGLPPAWSEKTSLSSTLYFGLACKIPFLILYNDLYGKEPKKEWIYAYAWISWFAEQPKLTHYKSIIQFSSVAQSRLTLCDPMDCSTPGFPVHHQLQEPTQTHVHRVGDAIPPSHPLSSPSPPAFNLSQHQGLFRWVSSSHEVANVLELQLQNQSFQWTPRTDLL